MKKNMGLFDKALRIVAAIFIVILYLTGTVSGMTATFLLVFAGLFLLTSLISFCPIYTALGIRTNKKQ
jgi:hypothetical protein